MSVHTTREILLTLSYLCDGDWKKMLDIIQHKKIVPSDEQVLEASSKLKASFITIIDENYPKCLKECNCPPMVLYYYGNINLLENQYKITCVGTRNPTLYQSEKCASLIFDAEKEFNNELCVISGMANGLDQVFMEECMNASAPIISVIGSGIDNPYPKNNNSIYEYCKSGKGLVLSEYPLDINAEKSNFVFRNRLLAALSNILFVGGGKKQSGTSTTVKYALDLGKEVCALPCNVTGDDLTNDIIKSGATSILSSKDLIEEIREICER